MCSKPLVFGCCLLFLGAGPTQHQPTVLKAERIVLVDKYGKELAILGTSKDGNPILTFNDTKGQSRLTIGVPRSDTAGMVSYHKNGKEAILISTGSDNKSAAWFFNPDGVIDWQAP